MKQKDPCTPIILHKMFNKSQVTIKDYPKSLNFNRISVKLSTRKPRLSSKSPRNTKKKIKQRIQSSFTVCDEIYSPHTRIRSISIERKHKTLSFDYSCLQKCRQPLQSFQQFDEDVFNYLSLGKQEIQKGNPSSAASFFSKAIEIDSKCLEALYHRGLANKHLFLYKEATIDFLNVLRENILYNKDIYLQISQCFHSIKDPNTALRYISQGLHRFPRYYEGYLYRGVLYNELKNFEKAMGDFKKVLSSSGNEGRALLGIAESLEGIGDTETAIKMLDQAYSCQETSMEALLRRGVLKSRSNDPTAAHDFDEYLKHSPACASAFFYKAELLYATNQLAESALCYEQCIKYDKTQEFSSRAIFHLGAIKIQEKDFYGALHTFERAGKHEVKDQKVLQLYAEAVINLMKRKYREGINGFNKLLKRQDSVVKPYIGLIYMYRGYGYNALNLHEKALRSFKKSLAFGKLNKASMYNQELSCALLAATKQHLPLCLSHLEKCLEIFPRKAEPYLYHAAIIVSQSQNPYDEAKLLEAEALLTTAMKMKDIDSEMLFFRGTVRYLMSQFQLALDDIKLSIEKAEDNIAEHYVLRGLCYAADRNYTEAIQDFTIALQLKESLDYLYWYRSRAAYLLDDTNLAFTDLQKCMALRHNDPEVYFHASVLLIMGGSYEDALKALASSHAIRYSAQTVYLKAKCFVIMNEVASAIEELENLKESSPGTALDIEILRFLDKASFGEWGKNQFLHAVDETSRWSKMETGEIFEMKHILWMRGVFLMYAGDFSEALNEFQCVLELLHTREGYSLSADETLTTEEENCEVLYNIALCHTHDKISQALVILSDLSEILNSKHKGQMLLLSAVIQLSLGNNKSAEQTLKDAFKCDPESVTPFLSKETTVILPLNTSNAFAQRFPMMDLDFSVDSVIRIRPAISLPRSTLPNLEFSVEEEAREFFVMSKITPRPEAPWLNRVNGSIQFTSILVDIDESSQISERELKDEQEPRNESQESLEIVKRHIKSAVPLRHINSFTIKEESGKIESSDKDEQDDILHKIRDFCMKKRNSNCD